MDNAVSIVLIGSVQSTKMALDVLVREGIKPQKVFGLSDESSKNVSGYCPLFEEAEKNGIPAAKFKKINDAAVIEELKALSPDYLFVIGLSQLISKDLLTCAKEGVVGVHPAPLPKYRGRAAMVWQMLLGEKESAVSLFFIDEGMDTGDIIVQEPFTISETDYAIDVDRKGLEALERALEKLTKMIKAGHVTRIKQDESKASYLLKRTPEDGEIDWSQSSKDIQLLVRAVSKPYPGAFSYYDGKHKIIIWKADYLPNERYFGLNGQVCQVTPTYVDVVCKEGILRIWEYEYVPEEMEAPFKHFVVGHKFTARK